MIKAEQYPNIDWSARLEYTGSSVKEQATKVANYALLLHETVREYDGEL
jgi:hypothetical protein